MLSYSVHFTLQAICPDVVKLFKISCNADDGKQMFISHRIKLQRVCLNYFLHIIGKFVFVLDIKLIPSGKFQSR